ncbi:MAG: Manganese transport system membrane protein MntC [Chlamydiales bacterium]|nr:Manganese transport system membrane protein MntC [Chlamydiales bacterium]MCH9620030.1 Manganese transport system membrane protein MntC [Chlamydiales bacterium]MCH9622867.1 Manganese transport system membrane protein MntC [Chlamydiales bacterium]
MILDPVLRAPLLGSMLMALIASLIGVLLFVRKRTLIGEALSHASYPGVTLAILISGWISAEWVILLAAFISSLLGFGLINFLKKRLKVKEDAALSFVLATFFGMGTLVASIVSRTHSFQFRQIQVFLYGQAATMGDGHVLFYALFALFVIALLVVFYRSFLVCSFDPHFAKISQLGSKVIESLFLATVAASVVIGIRSVGVIMMAALFIAPPIAARQFTNTFSKMFWLSALFGVTSGFLGTFLSLSGLPTGPMIVLVASLIALFSLLFAPKRGVVIRYLRVLRFRMVCVEENLLKALWHQKLVKLSPLNHFLFRWRGWIDQEGHLTELGKSLGARVVRAHRLWEAYLVYSLGMGISQVHHNAEEMEHLLTPELEEELTKLLDDPKQDPHAQPIPPREVFA